MLMFAIYCGLPFWLAYRVLWLLVGRRRAALAMLDLLIAMILMAIGMVISGLFSFLYEPHTWWTSIQLEPVIMDWFWGLGGHWADRAAPPLWPMFFVGYLGITQFMVWYVEVVVTHFNLAILICNAAMLRLFFLLRAAIHAVGRSGANE